MFVLWLLFGDSCDGDDLVVLLDGFLLVDDECWRFMFAGWLAAIVCVPGVCVLTAW